MARRSGGDAALACAIRALRLAANLAPLYRRGIDGEINDLCMGGGDIRAFVDGKVARWYDVVAWYGRPVLNLRNWLTRGDVQLDSAAREVTRDGSR